MNIYVLRHGETDWNAVGRWQGQEDIELNENGRTQAHQCAEKMRGRQFRAIITSPLKRARETADILAAVLGVESIHEDIDLIERDIGRVAGMTAEERNISFPDSIFEGMEEWGQLSNRVYRAVLEAAERFYPQDIMVVSHDAAIRALRSKIANHDVGNEKALSNGDITKLSYVEKTLAVI